MTTETLDRTDTATDAGRPAVSLPASQWRDPLAAVLLSVGKDATLPILATVHVSVTADAVVLTSTDRFRLTRVTIPLSSAAAPAPFTALVPADTAKSMLTLVKALKSYHAHEPFELSRTDDGVRFFGEWEHSSVSGRDQDGEFPRADGIIESARDGSVDVSKGDRLMVGFSPAHLTALCKMPREGNAPVVLSIGNPTKAALAEWELDGASYVHVLMPVRLVS